MTAVNRQNSSHHRAEVGLREGSHRRQYMHRRANGSPSYGRGIGDQIQHRRLKRLESQADHERAGDGHRRPKTRRAF